MGSITAANAQLILSVPGVFSAPQTLQGFDVDDIFDTDEVDQAELKIGVDGIVSAGYIFYLVPQRIMLQADSPSQPLFDQWRSAQIANGVLYPATMQVALQAIGQKWSLINGYLHRGKTMIPAKRVLQPRTFTITWGQVQPAAFTP
jgi:tail fiber protein gp32